jgi:hypothetical protein
MSVTDFGKSHVQYPPPSRPPSYRDGVPRRAGAQVTVEGGAH